MLRRQKTLALLHEELRTLAVFDRVHDAMLQTLILPDNRAHAARQIRRSQIMTEITKLGPPKPDYRNRAGICSAALFLCAVGYATVHYLLR